MRRTIISSLTVAALSATGAHAEIFSAYTDINAENTCSVFATNEEGGEFANLACNGYKGYPVLIYSGDLRESLFYGFPPGGDLQPAWESFSAFNSAGPKIEWRVEKEGNREIPFATIHRWFVSDAEDSSRQIEVLVVEKVGQLHERDGCAVGLVVASGNPQANETARKIADEQARNFICGSDERVIVADGIPLPDFQRQEP
jgi:hypothetical protein